MSTEMVRIGEAQYSYLRKYGGAIQMIHIFKIQRRFGNGQTWWPHPQLTSLSITFTPYDKTTPLRWMDMDYVISMGVSYCFWIVLLTTLVSSILIVTGILKTSKIPLF